MKRLCICIALAAAVLSLCAVPCSAAAADSSSVASSSASSGAAGGVGREDITGEDLAGADSIVGDVSGVIDGVYDNLPTQNGGLLEFVGSTLSALPAEFTLAVVLWLIFAVVLLLLRFLWG